MSGTATAYPAECGEHHEVEYAYYRYNSGDGHCGECLDRRTVPSAPAAVELAGKINASAAGKWENGDESEQDLLFDLLPSHGYFLGARAYRVQTERTPLTAPPAVPRR